jgi:hypothetical protein
LKELAEKQKNFRPLHVLAPPPLYPTYHGVPYHQASIAGRRGTSQHCVKEDSVRMGHEFVYYSSPRYQIRDNFAPLDTNNIVLIAKEIGK